MKANGLGLDMLVMGIAGVDGSAVVMTEQRLCDHKGVQEDEGLNLRGESVKSESQICDHRGRVAD